MGREGREDASCLCAHLRGAAQFPSGHVWSFPQLPLIPVQCGSWTCMAGSHQSQDAAAPGGGRLGHWVSWQVWASQGSDSRGGGSKVPCLLVCTHRCLCISRACSSPMELSRPAVVNPGDLGREVSTGPAESQPPYCQVTRGPGSWDAPARSPAWAAWSPPYWQQA
jgi:hypothetical protein